MAFLTRIFTHTLSSIISIILTINCLEIYYCCVNQGQPAGFQFAKGDVCKIYLTVFCALNLYILKLDRI